MPRPMCLARARPPCVQRLAVLTMPLFVLRLKLEYKMVSLQPAQEKTIIKSVSTFALRIQKLKQSKIFLQIARFAPQG